MFLHKKMSLFSFLFIMSIGNSLFAETVEQKNYIAPVATSYLEEMQKMNMRTVVWDEDYWTTDDLYYCITRILAEQLNPKPYCKRNNAFKLLIKYFGIDSRAKQVSSKNLVVREKTTWQDLEFFCGQDPEAGYVAQSLATTACELGKVCEYSLLADVVDDVRVLKNRQNIIRYFIENPELTEKLENTFKLLAEYENILLSFWDRDWFEQFSARFYYSTPGLKSLNQVRQALAIKSLCDHFVRTSQSFSTIVAAGTLTAYGITELLGIESIAKQLENRADRRKVGGIVADFLWDRNYKPLRGVIALLGGIYTSLQIQDSVTWTRDCFYLEQTLQIKLMHVARYFSLLEDIKKLVEHNEILKSMLPETKDIIELFDPAVDEVRSNFMELLQDESLQNGPSLLVDRGAVLLAFKTMHTIKDRCVDALYAGGLLEAYVGFALLYKKRLMANSPVSFVTYKTGDKPALELVNFTHPLIPEAVAVPNSLTLGKNSKPSLALITGPNAGGKSTLIKSFVVNVLLGQSVGMVFAEKATWVPFSNIATYLNITDDIQNSKSLFRAEALRAQDVLCALAKMPKGKFSLIAFDEMFRGATPQEGEAAAYSVTKYLCKQENLMALVATHFYALTDLELETGAIANYHVSVELGDNCQINYPFKLEPGISRQHIALDILQKEGIQQEILHEAYRFMHNK